jgi:hypothetical protein
MLQSFWRYRWQAYALALLICLVGWWAVFRFAKPQETAASFHLELSSAGTAGKAAANAAAVRDYLLDRKASSTLIAKLGSKFGAPPNGADWLDYMHDHLKITQTGDGHDFVASLSVPRPASAADMLNALLTSADQRIQGEDKATQAKQVAAANAALSKAQRRVSMLEQRVNKAREIATAENANQAAANANQPAANPDDANAGLRRAIQHRDEIRSKLNDLEAKANASSATPGSGDVNANSDPLAKRLKTLQAQLQSQLARFTEQHPDVVATRRLIEIAQKQYAAGKSLPRPGEATSKRMQALKATPAYAETAAELARVEAEVAGWQARVKPDQQTGSATDPAGSGALAAEYQAAKSHYDQLLAQQKAVTDAQDSEDRGQRFRVAQAARPATGWSAYRELVLSGAIWLLACLLGFALPQAMANLHPVVANPRSLQELSGWPILGTISAVLTSDEKQQLRADKVSYTLACATLVLSLLLIVGVQCLRPSWLQTLASQAG